MRLKSFQFRPLNSNNEIISDFKFIRSSGDILHNLEKHISLPFSQNSDFNEVRTVCNFVIKCTKSDTGYGVQVEVSSPSIQLELRPDIQATQALLFQFLNTKLSSVDIRTLVCFDHLNVSILEAATGIPEISYMFENCTDHPRLFLEAHLRSSDNETVTPIEFLIQRNIIASPNESGHIPDETHSIYEKAPEILHKVSTLAIIDTKKLAI